MKHAGEEAQAMFSPLRAEMDGRARRRRKSCEAAREVDIGKWREAACMCASRQQLEGRRARGPAARHHSQ